MFACLLPGYSEAGVGQQCPRSNSLERGPPSKVKADFGHVPSVRAAFWLTGSGLIETFPSRARTTSIGQEHPLDRPRLECSHSSVRQKFAALLSMNVQPTPVSVASLSGGSLLPFPERANTEALLPPPVRPIRWH